MESRTFTAIENHKRHWDALSTEAVRSILVRG
jgi:hypothetical protein